jgi:hypothetical protein
VAKRTLMVVIARQSQRQILNTDHDEAICANGLHVDIHVPKEDAQTHEEEEDGEHKNAELRCFPDVER